MHRLFNVAGCSLLLGSNYYSRKQISGCAFDGFNSLFGISSGSKTAYFCNIFGCNMNNKSETDTFFAWDGKPAKKRRFLLSKLERKL